MTIPWRRGVSELDKPEPCIECGAPTEIICSWCGVPLCQNHRHDVAVHWETSGGMPAGVSAEYYCESCMPDDEA